MDRASVPTEARLRKVVVSEPMRRFLSGAGTMYRESRAAALKESGSLYTVNYLKHRMGTHVRVPADLNTKQEG